MPIHRRQSMRLPAKQAGPFGGDCCRFLENRSSVKSPTLRCGVGNAVRQWSDAALWFVSFCSFSLFHHCSFSLLLGCFRPFVFGYRVKFAHRMFGAVVARRSESFALDVCSLNRVWFLKKLALLHSYLLMFVNLLKMMELLLKKVERDDRIWIRKSRMVCKLCEKSSSSTLQASTTASKRMHAVRFFWTEILSVAQAAGSGTSNTWGL